MENTMEFVPNVFHTDSNSLTVSIDFVDFVKKNQKIKINVIKHLRHLAKQTLYSITLVHAKNIIEFIIENEIPNMTGKSFSTQVQGEFISVVLVNYKEQLCIKFIFKLVEQFDYDIKGLMEDYLKNKYSINQISYDNYIVSIDSPVLTYKDI